MDRETLASFGQVCYNFRWTAAKYRPISRAVPIWNFFYLGFWKFTSGSFVMFFDPLYFILVGPFFLLGLLAQVWVKSAFVSGEQIDVPLSGAEAAREIMRQNGLDLPIECIDGQLSDHYDPTEKVLRLSQAVYHGRNAAAVGVAAHEVGHAIQDAKGYSPLVVRNMAVPLANLGSGAGIWLFIIGMIASLPMLVKAGIILFSCVVFFQVVNLPVEFNASTRAKYHLSNMGMLTDDAQRAVSKTLTAAAMTYVAATLQSVMTLVYLFMRGGDE